MSYRDWLPKITRKQRGRQETSEHLKSETMGTSLSPAQKTAVKQAARAVAMSDSEFVREAICLVAGLDSLFQVQDIRDAPLADILTAAVAISGGGLPMDPESQRLVRVLASRLTDQLDDQRSGRRSGLLQRLLGNDSHPPG